MAKESKASAKEAKGRLLAHALSFVLIVPILLAVQHFLTPGSTWAWWVAMGWGIGLAVHAVRYFTQAHLMDAVS